MCLDSGEHRKAGQTEIEWKLDLGSEENFIMLRSLLEQKGEHLKSLSQINYYLDTADHTLLQAREMLRLRRENASWVLTHKSRGKNENGLQSSKETEWPAPNDLNEENLLAWLKEQTAFPIESPVLLGVLHNQREVFGLDGFILELDSVRFRNGEEWCFQWELELETVKHPEARAMLESLFERAGIPFEPQTKSKFRRFLEFAVYSSITE